MKSKIKFYKNSKIGVNDCLLISVENKDIYDELDGIYFDDNDIHADVTEDGIYEGILTITYIGGYDHYNNVPDWEVNIEVNEIKLIELL